MEPSDIASLFFGDEESGPAKAQALAQALRGQQQLGQLGLLSGDKVVGGLGKSLLAGAQEQQDLIPKAANMRLQRAMEAEKAKAELAFRQAQEAHMQNQDEYQRQQLAQGKFVQGPLGVLNTRTGALDPYAKPVDQLKEQKDMEAQLGELAKAINRDTGRGSLMPQLQNRLNVSERIKAAATNPDGSVKDLSPAMITELAASTAALLTNGTPGEHSIAAMLPKGRGMKQAEIAEWLTNSPHGAGQQAYIQQMVDLANREEHVIGEQIRSGQLRQLPRFAPGFKKYGDTFWNAARGHIGTDVRTLVDPETMLPLVKEAAGTGGSGQAAGGGMSPEKMKRLEELRAKQRAGLLK